jgi:hypothetical protein
MITTSSFSFLYYKPKLCSYVTHIMTHLHLANKSWILNILKFYFEILNISNNYDFFSYVDGRLSSFQKKSIKIYLLR